MEEIFCWDSTVKFVIELSASAAFEMAALNLATPLMLLLKERTFFSSSRERVAFS